MYRTNFEVRQKTIKYFRCKSEKENIFTRLAEVPGNVCQLATTIYSLR
jgi:hypothetical protein